MVIAVVPVLGRYPLVPYTLRRLNRIVDKVICVVENNKDGMICAKEGAVICNLAMRPLGEKWNAGFYHSRQFDPDYVLYVGSSDWVSDNYLDVMLPIADGYDITGTYDYHLLHIEYRTHDDKGRKIQYIDTKHKYVGDYDLNLLRQNIVKKEVRHWEGYECVRKGEPIGIGRLVSRDYLNRVGWRPFEDTIHKSLDYSMLQKAKSVKVVMSGEAQSMAVSTNLWANKHEFEGKLINNNYLERWFPDALNLF